MMLRVKTRHRIANAAGGGNRKLAPAASWTSGRLWAMHRTDCLIYAEARDAWVYLALGSGLWPAGGHLQPHGMELHPLGQREFLGSNAVGRAFGAFAGGGLHHLPARHAALHRG